MKRDCQGSRGLRSGQEGCGGGVGSGGCVIITEFSMEGLHFLHTYVIGGTQLQLVHKGRWMKVDVVGEEAGLKGEGHALEYHFLVEVWGAKGSLAEAIDECPERLTLFLPDVEEGYCSSLVRAAASKVIVNMCERVLKLSIE